MTDTKQQKKTLKRSEDPDFLKNPLTGRYIKKGGKEHRRLINANILEVDTNNKDNIIATGSRSELELMKSKLQGTNFVPKGKKLEIRNGKLIFVRERVTKKQTVNKAKNDIVSAIKDNRKILNNEQLSESQIDFILNKVIDAKLMGISLNIEDEVAQLTKPASKPKPERRRAKKKKFRVLPPPSAVEETEVETDMNDYDSESE